MKFFATFAVLLLVLCTYIAASPIGVNEGSELTGLEDVDTDAGILLATNELPIRHRRVTCDLLSFQTSMFSFNHAACAGRCLAQGRKGGSCQGGVCVCR